MTGRRFQLVDVFTDRALAGNQLAVVLDSDGLDDASMQAIAREFNFSETTFVMPAAEPGCDWRVRIFTPVTELPVAGHPTVGTAAVLCGLGLAGDHLVFQLGVGPTPVDFDPEGRAWMTLPAATFLATVEDPGPLAAALSLAPGDLREDLPPQVVSCGNEFLLAPLASLEALARTRPDLGRWAEATAASAQRAVYAFVVAGEGRVRARMFAPGLAGGEDPATGSAAGPLGAYAARYLGLDRLSIVQGVEMGRPSLLHVDASGPRPRVGGASVIVAGGELRLPT